MICCCLCCDCDEEEDDEEEEEEEKEVELKVWWVWPRCVCCEGASYSRLNEKLWRFEVFTVGASVLVDTPLLGGNSAVPHHAAPQRMPHSTRVRYCLGSQAGAR